MATIYPLEVRPDGSFAIKADNYKWTIVLAAGGVFPATALPTDAANRKARYALFSSNTNDFLVGYTLAGGPDVSAAAPSTVIDGTGPDQNPSMRSLDDISKISIYAPTAATITVTFFE